MARRSVKDPNKVRAGHLGAQARWGPQRIARMGDLSPQQRELILSLIQAQRIANTVCQACGVTKVNGVDHRHDPAERTSAA